MSTDAMHPLLFGMVGVVDFSADVDSLYARVQTLVKGFERTPQTVTIAWYGEGVAAVTFLHTEDALVPPGRYEYAVPKAGSYQGIIEGHFFTKFEAIADADETPQGVSHAVVSDYANRGPEAFATLNGAWTAVILDKEQRSAAFARDAVGFETLYLMTVGPRIFFTTNLRSFRLAGLMMEHDEQAMVEFLHYLYVPSPRSVYKDVISVLPGHVLSAGADGMNQRRFSPPRFVRNQPLSDEAEIQAAVKDNLPSFEERLLSAAQSCVPRQGRIGLLLSGGKDSAALAVALKEVAPDHVVALTVGTSDRNFDESDYARRMAAYLGIAHIVYTPDLNELAPGFLNLMACQDQPMGDPASLPLFLALQHLPSDVSVVWDGTGNDYYFGSVRESDSYRYYKRVKFRKFVPGFAWSSFLRVMQLGPSRFASTAREWQRPLEEAFVSWAGWSQNESARLLQKDVDWSDTYLADLVRTHVDRSWVALQTEVFGAVWTPNAAIRKTVSAARALGYGVRMPFIDNRLAEYVNHLPEELKFRGCVNKTLLRAYLAAKLPGNLVQRPKGSFVFDQNLLLQSQDSMLLSRLQAGNPPLPFRTWSDTYLSKVIQEYQGEPTEYVDKIYALILLNEWMALSHKSSYDGNVLCAS